MEVENVISITQLNTEQKLSVRDAQYQIVRAEQLVQQSIVALKQLVEKLINDVVSDPSTVMFNLDTLEIVPKQ